MAWQKSIPAATDQLKDSQLDIKENFEAIEEGGVPYDHLELQQQGSAPTEPSGSNLLYSLTSDENIYMKRDGVQHKVGPQYIVGYATLTDSAAVAGNNDTAAPSPTLSNAFNLSVVGGGGTNYGKYDFTLTTALGSSNYFPMISYRWDSNTNLRCLQHVVTINSSSTFTVQTYSGSGNLWNKSFDIIVIGAF